MPIDVAPTLITQYGLVAVSLVVLILLGLVAHFLIRRGLTRLEQTGYITEAHQLVLRKASRWVIIALVILLGLQQIGVGLTSIWAALSAAIVLIGVGLVAIWSVVSNVFCSLLLLAFKPFRIGDKIEIISATGGGSGLRGEVINLTPAFTLLKEEDGDGRSNGAIVYIPNNTFFQNTLRRWRGTRTESLYEYMFREKSHDLIKEDGI